MSDGGPVEAGRRVLAAEIAALKACSERLGAEFEAAVEAIVGCPGRVVVSGMGKSGLIARKIAATLSSTGTPSFFLHPAEAVHGDLGGVVPGDVAILLSHGGETEELLRLLPLLRDLASRTLGLTGSPDSSLGRTVDFCLDTSVPAEACPLGLAPTASSTAALAMGDALAMAVMERKGFSAEQFSRLHPGGRLGERFLKVRDVMHGGEELPQVAPDTPIRSVIQEISAKRLGMTTVVTDGKLVGVITDGDLRRLFERVEAPLDVPADQVMSRHPRTITTEVLAARARELMEWPRKITALVVVDEDAHPLGVLHFHDLSRLPR